MRIALVGGLLRRIYGGWIIAFFKGQGCPMSSPVIVVPCYNEANRLDVEAFRRFAEQPQAPRFLLVNDGSRDETPALLDKLHAGNPAHFAVCHLPRNVGKAEAVRQGLLAALETDAGCIGYWDADLATPLEAIDEFRRVLARRPDVDVVVGSRLSLLGRRIHRRPLRRFLGRLFARTASFALGLRIVDTQCGAKLFRATPDFRRLVGSPFLARWIFDVEIFARLILMRGSTAPPISNAIYELPLDTWEDVAGSKLKSGDFVKAVLELAAIYWRYLRPGVASLPQPASETDPVRPLIKPFAPQQPSKRAA